MVTKVISAGKNQCLRNAYSPVKYNNSLHRQMHVEVCYEIIKPGWKLAHSKHLSSHSHHRALIHPGGKSVCWLLIPRELAILLLQWVSSPCQATTWVGKGMNLLWSLKLLWSRSCAAWQAHFPGIYTRYLLTLAQGQRNSNIKCQIGLVRACQLGKGFTVSLGHKSSAPLRG